MIDPKALLAESVEVLRREIPEDLEWLPWNELPELRFANGAAVDGRIPRGLLVAAAARGVPEPDAALRERLALFDPKDAARFGNRVLREWIACDTAEPGLTEARRTELRGIAERAAGLARRLGRGGGDPEERYRQLVAQEENRPAVSALPYQGLLAVTAACGDRDAVGDLDRYLERYRDERPERCRVLRRVRSWIVDSGRAT